METVYTVGAPTTPTLELMEVRQPATEDCFEYAPHLLMQLLMT